MANEFCWKTLRSCRTDHAHIRRLRVNRKIFHKSCPAGRWPKIYPKSKVDPRPVPQTTITMLNMVSITCSLENKWVCASEWVCPCVLAGVWIFWVYFEKWNTLITHRSHTHPGPCVDRWLAVTAVGKYSTNDKYISTLWVERWVRSTRPSTKLLPGAYSVVTGGHS